MCRWRPNALDEFRWTGWITRTGVLLVILLLLLPSFVSAITHTPTSLQPGAISDPANGTTVIATQGFGAGNRSNEDKPARLIGVGPRGNLKWVHHGPERHIWFYDVDPLSDGNLLITGITHERTVVYSWDPKTDEIAWKEHFDMEDTHDVDLINGDQLLIANMRNYNESTGKNDDRIVVYDRSKDEIVWEWKFRNHYDRSSGGKYTDDWTHVNDVDKIGPGRYMASPRNLDQVIVIDRSTKDIEMRLGNNGNHEVLYAQHNPQYLVTENGTPALLVADSENDRVVEYTKSEEGWSRTWSLGSSKSLNWPRDADRLPNGNTLVVDTLNHRVLEVTPTGEIVWEYYATWGPYDAERISLGEEPGGPTMQQFDTEGWYEITGSAGVSPGSDARISFSQWVTNAFAGTRIESQVRWVASRWAHITPWIRPIWMGPWDFVAALSAVILTLLWGGGELLVRRERIRTKIHDTYRSFRSDQL